MTASNPERPAPAWLTGLIRGLDRCTDALGHAVSWLTVLMVLISCSVVVLRYFFDISSIALQESVIYLHASVFLLGAGYALKHHNQVRVDIFYRRFSPRGRSWVDVLGSLILLLPLTLFTGWISWDFVVSAWRVRETSTDAGGLGAVYWLKSLLLVFSVSLALQALAELLRNLLRLMGLSAPSGSHQETGHDTGEPAR